MKTYFPIMFLLLMSMLFSQVNFEYDFSFERLNPDDGFINIWLDDLDEDGIDEIHASCRYFSAIDTINVWGIVTYNLSGEIISNFEQNTPNNKLLAKCVIFKNQNSTYLVSAFFREEEDGWNFDSYLDIEVYDFYTLDFINSISLEMGNYALESGTYLSSVKYIKPIIIQDMLTINVGITKCSFYEGPDEGWGTYTTKMEKFSFENSTLELLEEIVDCGTTLKTYYGLDHMLTTGYYNNQSSYGMGQASSTSRSYYIKSLSLENPSEIIDILYLHGSVSSDYIGGSSFDNFPAYFTIMNNNDLDYLEYGLMSYYKLRDDDYGIKYVFRNYSSDFTDTLWTSLDTYIIDGRISARTCVSVNDESHYMMYFNENQLEIRNRMNGNIIHYQNSFINPFSIQRKSDGELLFFTYNEDETGYDLYALDGEIQVSANDNQMLIANYKLQNYPNPFNPSTTIEFSIQNDSNIELGIYNIKGQKIKAIASNAYSKGDHSIIWNGVDESGKSVSSGIYYYMLNVNGKTKAVKKCLLLK